MLPWRGDIVSASSGWLELELCVPIMVKPSPHNQTKGASIMKWFIRLKLWNEWRKANVNSKLHQFAVLFNLIPSPTFEMFISSNAYKLTETEFKRYFD